MYKHTVILCACLAMAGCKSTPFQRSSNPPVELLDESAKKSAPVSVSGLAASPQRRFKDIPLPNGLREDTQSTFVYDSKSVKIGKMVYTSKASVNELAQFYISNAPNSDWRLLSTTQADDSISLFFEKPGRRLNVDVKRRGIGRGNVLILTYLPAEEL